VVDGSISTSVVVDDAGLSGHGHTTVLELTWRSSDPLAVGLRLSARPDHPALPRGDWSVLRDFLRYGTTTPTGDGMVKIAPAPEGMVQLSLRGDARPYAFRISAAVLLAFLDETYAIVPTGEEASEETLDALIRRLLDS
jgi:hypothetical protein